MFVERTVLIGLVLTNFDGVLGEALKFPSDFQFGVATASYQIEGGWNANGKGVNIWDILTHNHPEWVKDRSTGDIACDSYNLWKEDVALIKNLGANFYRFSLSWSRLLPNGFSNVVNPDGVRYYNNIIDELLANNIQPLVTIYHWDLPQPLQDLGGWPNPHLVKYFEDYARVVFELFGDRVKNWITFNEPFEVCQTGYGSGEGAPGIQMSGIADYLCGKTLLLAHAKAYRLYQARFKDVQKGKIGITISAEWGEPKTQNPKDVEAAQRSRQMDYGWWVHPIFSKTGDYPELMKNRIAELSKLENFTKSRLPEFSKDEVVLVQGTYDFLGLNHYTSRYISDAGASWLLDSNYSFRRDVGVNATIDPKWKKGTTTWEYSVPWGFRNLLNDIKSDYDNPLVYITENGWPDSGELDDEERIQYYVDYLTALLEAIQLDGCNVKGFTAWSLLDNMEWEDGYTVKFGLYHVNFTDPGRKRTPKASVAFFKKLIETRVIPTNSKETPDVEIV